MQTAPGPLLPLLKDDAPPVEGGDAAGHLQSKTQAARPLKQLPLIGFREKTRSVVPHGEDRPPAPAGQAQAGLSALSRRADGVGDQVEQQPPELGPVSMGKEAPYLLLIGKADASQRRQGRHLLPQLPAQPGQIQRALPQGELSLRQFQILKIAHHTNQPVQALVQNGQIGVVLRPRLLPHHRREQLNRCGQVVHLLTELLYQERSQILSLLIQMPPTSFPVLP